MGISLQWLNGEVLAPHIVDTCRTAVTQHITRAGQAKAGQAKASQSRASQSRASQGKPSQSRATNAEKAKQTQDNQNPSQAKSSQAKPQHANPTQRKAKMTKGLTHGRPMRPHPPRAETHHQPLITFCTVSTGVRQMMQGLPL